MLKTNVDLRNMGKDLGIVVCTCNPSTQEARWENCKFKASLGNIEAPISKKIWKTK
jgi:hypothetical protein